MPESREVKFRVTNGLSLAGLSWGESHPRKVLALHGWLDNAASYHSLANKLANDYHLVAMDFAGHGLSSHRPEGVRYHLLDNVDDVIQFADALGWDEFCLMGHSMGAGIATYTTAAFPERIKALILLEGAGTHATPPDEAPGVLRKAVRDMERTPDLRKPIYPTLADAVKARTSVVGSISEQAAEWLCERGTHFVNAEKPGEGVTWTSDPRLRMSSAIRLTEPLVQGFMQQIECETLFVGADNGFWGRMPAIQERLKLIRQLTQVSLPGNHHHHLEPDTCAAVADAILGFLAEQGKA